VSVGDRVRLKGKKRMAFVRRATVNGAGRQIMLTRALGGFLHWGADELELC
jgi:hypothetical protein